ncbi:MAG: hypothetical protein AAGF12_36930 [Myxococcota bacterium]
MARLSDTLRDAICHLVRKDMIPPPTAAQANDVTFKTFQNWMRTGAADDWALRDTPHATFYREVSRAASDAQIRAQRRLMKSADRVESENIKWLLERWDTETYGRQVTIHVRNTIREEMALELMGQLRETLDVESYSRVESRLLSEGDPVDAGEAD